MGEIITLRRQGKVPRGVLVKEILRLQTVNQALKDSLTRRRMPDASPCARATVDELLDELECRPREEVEASMAARNQHRAAAIAEARAPKILTGAE